METLINTGRQTVLWNEGRADERECMAEEPCVDPEWSDNRREYKKGN